MVVPYPDETIYPSSDGKPMAENTLQFRWITIIKGGMDAVFKDDPNVFVAGDLLWYPVRGEPSINAAPDTMVVVGRPKGHRLSYLQWNEDDLPPQVVFEVTSPSKTTSEMAAKLDWYEQYGVEEYYVYDPDRVILQGWVRKGETLVGVPGIRHGFTSPRTRVHLKLEDELVLTGPDGRRFLDYVEVIEQRDAAEQREDEQRDRADREYERAERERERAERERNQREEAERRAEAERERAERERQEREEAERNVREAVLRAEVTELLAQDEARRAAEAQEAAQRIADEYARLLDLLRQRGIDPESLS